MNKLIVAVIVVGFTAWAYNQYRKTKETNIQVK